MAEEKKYIQRLNRAKSRRRKFSRRQYVVAAAVAAVVLAAAVLLVRKGGRGSGNGEDVEVGATDSAQPAETPITVPETTLSEEELAAIQLAQDKQAVVDSYTNLGLVQVSGYLNVRESPGPGGKIIGKLQENSVCEILDSDGEWHHITSGGIEGYINNQYVISGEEAREAALEQVALMAIVNTEKLNIRSEPVLDSANVVGQALIHERYPVLEETEGWVRIEEGYISSDYVQVCLALNEARKLDLRAMALNQYDNLVISKVSGYLNIRKDPSMADDTNVIGKFPGKAAGEILETQDGWYKIKSGAITGFITADSQYVAVGQEARDLALDTATLMAIVNTDKLNVRSEPSTDSKIWTQISKEERYSVVDQLDGWVQIELDSGDSEDG